MIAPVEDQPILLYDPSTPEPCCGDSGWNHEYFTTDIVTFQLLLAPADDAETLITNGTFIDGDSADQVGWSKTGLVAYNIGGTGAWLQEDGSRIFQDPITGFDAGEPFLLRILVRNVGALALSQGTIEVTGTSEPIEFIPNSQQFEQYVTAGIDPYISIRLNIEEMGNEMVFIQNVEILPIEIPDIVTEDSDSAELSTVTGISQAGQFLSVAFQPTSLEIAEKCFRFRVGEDLLISEFIQLVRDNLCTLLLGGCSNNNMYSPGSELFARLKGKIRADQTPLYNRFTTKTNLGVNRLNYGRKEKVWTLYIDRVPEHVRAWLYSFPLYNTIGIKEGLADQRNFFIHEEPDAPEFTATDDQLASVSMQIVLKESLQESIFASNCNFILPPKALGSRALEIAIKAGTDTAIKVP